MTNHIIVPTFILVTLLCASLARAQSFEVGAHVVSADWSEFEEADLGFGARLGWKPVPVLGLEGQLTWFPADYPDASIAFSASRLEGMFAATAGPRFGRVRPFVRAGAGFLRVAEAPEPVACIAIFPPPLSCVLAAGDTLPAFEIGGGVEVFTTPRTFLRFDAGDRILKYPGPSLSPTFEVHDEGFLGHAFRFSVGGGLRF